MRLEDDEPTLQRASESVADTLAAIRRDFAASGREAPSEAVLRRAADIVANYPDAWPRYDAHPDDWDGRYAVAALWTWRKVRAELDLRRPGAAAA
jgi:hypothetical protein